MKHNPLIRGEKSLIVVSLEELKATESKWRWKLGFVALLSYSAGLIMGALIEKHF